MLRNENADSLTKITTCHTKTFMGYLQLYLKSTKTSNVLKHCGFEEEDITFSMLCFHDAAMHANVSQLNV